MLIRPGQSGCDPWAGVAMKGESTTSSASSSDTKDQRNAIGGSGLLAGQGSTINFSIANPDGFAQLIAATAGTLEAGLEFAQEAQERSYAFAAEAKRSEEQHLGLQVLKSAGPILMIVGLGFALMKGAR